MPVVVHDEEILVNHGDAKFYFAPVALSDLLQMSGVGVEGLPDKKQAVKDFMVLLPTKIKRWENVVDSKEQPLECTPENFNRLPALVAMEVINKFANASGLSEDFEKNSGERSNENAS